MNWIHRTLSLVALASLAGSAFAQANSGVKQDEPIVGLGFHLKAGNFWNYAAKEQKPFYSLTYKGMTIFSKGSAPDPTTIGEDPIDFGDQPLSVAIENGFTKIGGSLFTSTNTTPLNFINGLGDRFRLIAGIDAQLEKDKQSTYRVGVEYSPKINGMPVFKTGETDGETFLAFGVSGEHRSDPTSGTSDIAAAIYRGRIGVGFDYSLSVNKIKRLRDYAVIASTLTPESLPAFITSLLSHDSDLKNLKMKPADVDNWTGLLGLTVKTVSNDVHMKLGQVAQLDTAQRQKVIDRLRELISGPLKRLENALQNPDSDDAKSLRSSLRRNQPRFAIFAEFEGSYSLTKQVFDRKYRSIYSGNVRFYFDASKPDDGYITLRYENGFSRAEPDKRTNSFVIMFGKSF